MDNMIIKQAKTTKLNHRASFLRSAPYQSLFVTASGDGDFSILDFSLTVKKNFSRSNSQLRGFSIHPYKAILALIENDDLVFIDLDGNELGKQIASSLPSDYTAKVYDSCLFNKDGDYVWSVITVSNDEKELQLYQLESRSVVKSLKIEDPLYQSASSLYHTSKPDIIALWLAAGQDGQLFYWLKNSPQGLICELEPNLADTTPPWFSPTGDEFLVADDETLCRYNFPKVEQTGSYQWCWEEGDGFGYCLCYLDKNQVLLGSGNGRLFLFDVNRMTIFDEIVIEDHEPKPAEELYNLVGDKSPCSDISFFERLGDSLIFVYPQNRKHGLKDWQDSLLVCSVNDLLNLL